MLSPNDLRKACEIPDDGSLGSLARQQLPLIADRIDALEADLAASQALVAAKEKRLQRRSEDWHDEMKHKGDWIECSILTCSVDREALAFKEADMLERLK